MGGKVCGSNPLSKSTALLWSCGDSFPFLDGIAMLNPNILQRVSSYRHDQGSRLHSSQLPPFFLKKEKKKKRERAPTSTLTM